MATGAERSDAFEAIHEAGVKRPSGMAIQLLMIVQKHGLKILA